MHTIRRVKRLLRENKLREDHFLKAIYNFLHFHNPGSREEFKRLLLIIGAIDEKEEQDQEFC
jgi:hypothetical protein